jgi:hypothetical protein
MAFFFPVAAYLLFLAIINGRPHATIISGPWDFVGVLFATCGFWLVGGPVILWVIHSRWRPALVQGGMSIFATGDWSFIWVFSWIIYFALLLGLAVFVLWRRHAYTLVYNVEPALLEGALGQVFGRLGLAGVRIGHRIIIQEMAADPNQPVIEAVQTSPGVVPRRALPGAAALGSEALAADGKPESSQQALARLDLDLFPSMRNVSMRWRSDSRGIRRDVEAELSRLLAEVETPENPIAGWLLTVSSCMFSAIFLCLVGFLVLSMRR